MPTRHASAARLVGRTLPAFVVAVVLIGALPASAASGGRKAKRTRSHPNAHVETVAAAAKKPPKSAPTMALLPAVLVGVQDDVGERADRALERAAESRGEYRVLDAMDMIPKLGEAQSLGVQCQPKDIECLIKLGILLELDHVVSTTVSPASDRYAIETVWVDARAGREVGRVRSLVDKAGVGFEGGIGDVVAALLDSTVPPARLVVGVSEPGARIRIDGVEVGNSPLPAPVADLTPGPHKVVVEKDGFRPVERDVLLAAGVPMALEIVLAEDGPTQSGGGATHSLLLWSGVSAAGIGALGALGGGAGAFAMNGVLLDKTKTVDERAGARATGQALVFTAAGGALVAAVGAGLIGLALATPP